MIVPITASEKLKVRCGASTSPSIRYPEAEIISRDDIVDYAAKFNWFDSL